MAQQEQQQTIGQRVATAAAADDGADVSADAAAGKTRLRQPASCCGQGDELELLQSQSAAS